MGIENQKPNDSEIIKPTSEGQTIESESQIVGVEKESQALELSLEQSEKRLEGLEQQFDTPTNIKNQAESSLDPRIVAYFREQLGSEETLNRLRHLGPEWIPKIQDAILSGKLETVAYYMSLADPENNPEANVTYAGKRTDYKTDKEWLAAVDVEDRERMSHILSYGAKQMNVVEDIKRRYDPEKKYGAHYAGPKFDELLDKLGMNKKESTDPQEKAIQEKLQSIPDKFRKLKSALSSMNPDTRKIIVDDNSLLNATEQDFERWQGYL
ncbi:MAG: hypothetical protein A3B74_02885 [Candidatus Kerfeldbacteria bacterium RIFCSPHIGHO2_02_FULL_42_14]|uniref:Uncharacterized protein n=1 Tax=Candidatus Kerfeldbacteria bacterium RIFCSPHIGHO2_02_FULL_42_14 TaxID=1798540 RepID=A0A1G2AUK1_9BACT|nr:MAG: hypothetical protein A3B74_02885 [Candidatus Kerfeldbacteria bacterium RIFCSPHIGHO2_02_FULL_42_14]OGY81117.1 MAG: hypothetical protein A3E60_02185 [Candidatus Kerfeldbacteria bacterium RIFCSPHIGHO2_12_FULL_42_13]OGY83912.1 MAG: hypothetical protein A3I91_05025 [Candidatus Kerfeldbacteria bacterium RIFCSPLOWO2_02_FULL_42_19]OGY86549.1 MAG: hypothetical protein A3G01_04805 [Candidatus Kerfeldbacteria bacterium RIFCSPLOWO2_12_FULL_43_9]